MAWTEQRLEAMFPAIPWREPIRVALITHPDVKFACRFCIALNGLQGRQVEKLSPDIAVVAAHIEREHPGVR